MTGTQLTYFPATGYWYDVESPLTGGSTSQLQFLVISAFVTFTARVPIGFTAQIANLDLGNGNTGSASVAFPPINARIHDGQLSTIDATDTPGIQLVANSAPIATALAAQNIDALIYDVEFTHVVYAEDSQTITNFAFLASTDTTPICITDPTLTRLPYLNSSQVPGSLTVNIVPDSVALSGSVLTFSAGGKPLPVPITLPATTGNAATSTKLQTARNINGVAFDGTANITVVDSTKQPADADLTAIAALTSAADKVPYSTGAGAWALADFTAAGRALVDDADVTAQRATLGVGPLLTTVTVLTANTAPTKFQSTSYDATSGALAVPLPALSGLTAGDWYGVQRYQSDVSTNAITFTPNGADTFDSGGTSFSLPMSGELRYFTVVTVASVKKWAVTNGNTPVSSNDKRYFSLNDGPFSGIATMLRHDRCALMQGFGDSTMSGPGRAFDMMGIDLATYYDANMWYMPFDDTNKTYFNPTALRTSSRGVRGVGGTGGKIAGTYQGKLPTGDITVDMMLTMPSWTPAASSELLTKWDEAIAGAGHSDQKGIHFGIGTTGLLYFGWTTDGATTTTSVSTAAVPFTAGNPGWVKAVFQANDGSGNNTVKFYTSSSGFSYAQLGSTVTTAGTVTSVYQSTTPYQLLSRNKEFATNHAPTGTYVHFLRVRDSAGNDYVPVLPDKWDPNPTSTLEPVYNSGAPILLCPSGAISGWNLGNLTDPVRYTQLMSIRGADMIIVDDGHNEQALTQRQFIDQYVSFIRRLKRSKPLVPIVCMTQNPYDKAGTAWTSEPGLADLNPTKMAWMAKAMAGESGVWVADTFQAFTNPTVGNDLIADGRHPSAVGYQKKADFTRRFLLPKAFI